MNVRETVGRYLLIFREAEELYFHSAYNIIPNLIFCIFFLPATFIKKLYKNK